MPFDQETKSSMFIKSARICCLCYKQCGVNIEAAHITAEADGGSNKEDNGIPVCFDCHQEIGAYDVRHPKGNKFSRKELIARRNKVYELVETGVLQARIITSNLYSKPDDPELDISNIKSDYKPSSEVENILSLARNPTKPAGSIPLKLNLMREHEKAYIIDSLVNDVENEYSLNTLMSIVSNHSFEDINLIILEQVLRRVALSNDLPLKADFMDKVPIELLKSTDEGLRTAFFTEIIGIINMNQYNDVNIIVPKVGKVQDAIPEAMLKDYVKSILEMADSGAWRGKPAAQEILLKMPDRLINRAIRIFNDQKFLFWHYDKFYKKFLEQNKRFITRNDHEILYDFLTMSENDFFTKWEE